MIRSLCRSIMFPGCAVAFEPAASFAGRTPSVTLVDYEAEDGARLHGAWVRSGASGAPVMLYFHGNGESAAQNLSFAEELARRGIDVFLAEYRGYGGLPGSPGEQELYRDGAAALEVLHLAGVPRDSVVLVGRSLGTGVAVELAHRGHGASLILLTPYTSMVDFGRAMVGPMAEWLVEDRFDNASKIGAIDIPVLIVHGTHDEVVPYAMGERLAAAGTPPARLITVPNAGHALASYDVPSMLVAELLPAKRRAAP